MEQKNVILQDARKLTPEEKEFFGKVEDFINFYKVDLIDFSGVKEWEWIRSRFYAVICSMYLAFEKKAVNQKEITRLGTEYGLISFPTQHIGSIIKTLSWFIFKKLDFSDEFQFPEYISITTYSRKEISENTDFIEFCEKSPIKKNQTTKVILAMVWFLDNYF